MENRYAVINYPSFGDETYFDHAFCSNCGNHVHSYTYLHFRKKEQTEPCISDKHNRHKFQELIECGQAFIIPAQQDKIPKNTRAQVLACEWTLRTIQPADQVTQYLHLNENALWVSNKADNVIRAKRERWLKQLRRPAR